MRIYIFFLMLFCTSLLSGCESLVNDLDQDKLPKAESKLAVECYISPQSEKIMVIVTESQPIFGPSTYEPIYIKNAKVVLSDDVKEIVIPYIDSTSAYMIESSRFEILEGKKYTLTVTDGTRNIRAQCVVPAKRVIVKNYSVDTIANYRFDGDTVARVKISWEDIKGENNYYTLRGYSSTEETSLGYDVETGGSKPVRSFNQRLLDFNYQDYLVNDVNLDGITFNSPVFYVQLPRHYSFTYIDKNGVQRTADSDPVFKELRIEILNLDENYYRFYRTMNEGYNNDNPFVEPTLVYSNIEGGLGCFGAFNARILSIKP